MKLRNIMYLGAMMLAVTSCEDTLDKAPVDLLSSNGFYQSTAQADQGILGVYADLRQMVDCEYYHMSEFRSDNVYANPQPNGQRDYSDISTFRAGSELGTFENTWNNWYKVIYDANVAIQKISAASYDNAAAQAQYLAEAHFLRGWAYFELARLYGNVPVLLEPVSPSVANSTGQTDAKTVINDVVIPDLQAALGLPEKGNIIDATGKKVPDQGRADKTAAQAMLARVYMTLAGFPFNDESATAEAEKYLDLVLAKKSAYWAPTIDEWRLQFTPDGNNKYSVFAIQYRTGGTGNPGIFNMVKVLPPSFTGGVGVRLFGNDVYVEKSVRHEWDKVYSTGNKDLRGEGWSVLDEYPEEGNTVAYSNSKDTIRNADGTIDQVYTESQIYKPLPSKAKMDALGLTMNYASLKDYYDWPCNYAVIRIEDMMLLKAEILAGKGDVNGALDLVNEIRERAGIDKVTAQDKVAALNLVKHERRLELFGEGVRWFDEVRYGTWRENTLAKFARYNNPQGFSAGDVSEGRYLYPIPANQMNISPGTYTQNTGY